MIEVVEKKYNIRTEQNNRSVVQLLYVILASWAVEV